MNLTEASLKAKTASKQLRNLSLETRNQILLDFAENIENSISYITEENQKDMDESDLSDAKKDRLMLNEKRLKDIAQGIRETVKLPDPLHITLEERDIAQGLHLKKFSEPMGVIGIIFESRPNVSADCSALCLKAGSSCILKGGKESYRSCKAIIDQMHTSLAKNGINTDAVLLAERPSHEETNAWISDRSNLDLLIPRGGKKLIQSVVNNAKVPVIETGAGVCHIYVEKSADFKKAESIIVNAKCQRPSVCNAMETLLVEDEIADTFIPVITETLKKNGVEIYGDERSCEIDKDLKKAEEESWYTEYNDLIMNLKVVKNTQEAINHIEKYGTHHSESILSEDAAETDLFMHSIDSACLYHNASTRFTDGFEFGLGAEIGISTQKLHARGPMGLRELTTYTYFIEGKGESRL